MTRLFIIDDDADYRLVLRLALEDDASLVVSGEAGTTAAAVAQLPAAGADLILLDTVMAGEDALDALPLIRQAAPDAGVVLISGFADEEMAPLAQAGGVLGLLSKKTPATALPSELATLGGLVQAVQRVVHDGREVLSPEPSSARAARRFASGELQGLVDDDPMDTVTLLTSELVTNAVIHAGTEVEVRVRLTADRARVEITDAAAGEPVLREPSDDETGGRGLRLLSRLARRWGVRHLPSGGKTVWFEVDRSATPATEPQPSRR